VQRAAEVDGLVGAYQRQDPAILHLARLDELDRIGGGAAGSVALAAIQQLHVAAVGVGRIQMNAVAAVAAGGVVPAAVHDAAVGEQRRVDVVALVVGDLADVGGLVRVRIDLHHVQHECRFIASLGLRLEVGLALAGQHRLGIALARRGEQHAAVGEVVRRDVLGAGVGVACAAGELRERAGGDVVLPDVPGRRVAELLVGRDRAAHREDQPGAVVGGVQILDVVQAGAGHARREIALDAGGRGAIAQVDVGVRPVGPVAADVVEAAQIGEQRRIGRQIALDVGDGEVDGRGAG
jgi:hypothetical protein